MTRGTMMVLTDKDHPGKHREKLMFVLSIPFLWLQHRSK
jgi:hypothetical protein